MAHLDPEDYSFGTDFSTTEHSLLISDHFYATPDASRRGSEASAFDDAMDTDSAPSVAFPQARWHAPPTATATSTTASFYTARTASDRPSTRESRQSFIHHTEPVLSSRVSSSAATSTARSPSLPRQAKPPALPTPAPALARSRSHSRVRSGGNIRFTTPEDEYVPAVPPLPENAGRKAQVVPSVGQPQARRMASHGVLNTKSSLFHRERRVFLTLSRYVRSS